MWDKVTQELELNVAFSSFILKFSKPKWGWDADKERGSGLLKDCVHSVCPIKIRSMKENGMKMVRRLLSSSYCERLKVKVLIQQTGHTIQQTAIFFLTQTMDAA